MQTIKYNGLEFSSNSENYTIVEFDPNGESDIEYNKSKFSMQYGISYSSSLFNERILELKFVLSGSSASDFLTKKKQLFDLLNYYPYNKDFKKVKAFGTYPLAERKILEYTNESNLTYTIDCFAQSPTLTRQINNLAGEFTVNFICYKYFWKGALNSQLITPIYNLDNSFMFPTILDESNISMNIMVKNNTNMITPVTVKAIPINTTELQFDIATSYDSKISAYLDLKDIFPFEQDIEDIPVIFNSENLETTFKNTEINVLSLKGYLYLYPANNEVVLNLPKQDVVIWLEYYDYYGGI